MNNKSGVKSKQKISSSNKKNNSSCNTSFKKVSKSAKGKYRTQNQAGANKHFSKKKVNKKSDENIFKSKNNDFHKVKTETYCVRHITIKKDSDGQRLDNYLRRFLPSIPKSRLYQMIRKGEVRLNKKRVRADSRLTEGDILRIPPTTVQDRVGVFIPEKALSIMKKSVLYRDDNFMVINKPAGIAVHSGSKNQYGVIDTIRQSFPDEGWELCHRLDKDTSGCLVLAKNRAALNAFQNLSIAGDIHKQYLTLVKGTWVANELLIDTPIEKTTVSRMNYSGEFELVDEGGHNKAISIFTTRENYAKSTLMQVVIKTGKTHQIRVHASLNNHPVAMDDKYGNFKWNRAIEKIGLPRMFLHSHIIRFKAFDEIIHISADLPDDLQGFIDNHC